ncbi:MAG: RDD family protein [Candidatus Dadabacteria bacterium]|nr:RDD family protein [Candidatus Dadabacteria bacterium]
MDTNTERRIWHYDSGNRPRGPYTESEIAGRIAEGEVTGQTLVWAHPMEEWLPAATVETFRAHFAKGEPLLDDPTVPAGPGFVYVSQMQPWARYFARHLDYAAFGLVAIVVSMLTFSSVHGILTMTGGQIIIAVILLTLVWAFVEAALISVYGTTPGKYLLGIHVADSEGRKPGIAQSLRRSLRVWAMGIGMALPIVGLVAQFLGWRALKRHGVAPWDRLSRTEVEHFDYHILSPIFYFFTLCALAFLAGVLIAAMGR